MDLFEFYKGKKVMITGHTGFKGTWMCKVLSLLGADVLGYSLEPVTLPNLFDLCVDSFQIQTVIGDIRDLQHLLDVFFKYKPEIIIHMAAQPIVRESYKNPVNTYEINVMGTVNLLECVRMTDCARSVINVTTDKVYLNREWQWGYRENEELNGFDPYSNSKSCSELVTSSYINSFFKDRNVAVSTCRAGNVIGGGDFAVDRIIPDCVRAVEEGKTIAVRNPYSTRPYQHVLEPVVAYLMIAQAQYENNSLQGAYNIGPDDTDCWTTGKLVEVFCDKWNRYTGDTISWINQFDGGPHEATFLKLDCSKIKNIFGWSPKWDVSTAMDKIVEWSVGYLNHKSVVHIMDDQIKEYLF